MIPPGRQNIHRHIWQTSKISRNIAGEWHLVCNATARTKTALGIPQFWFHYLPASFFEAIVIHFSHREADERRCHGSPCILACLLSCVWVANFLCSPWAPCFLINTSKQMNLSVKCSEHFRSGPPQLVAFRVFSVLTAKKSSVTVRDVESEVKCPTPTTTFQIFPTPTPLFQNFPLPTP